MSSLPLCPVIHSAYFTDIVYGSLYSSCPFCSTYFGMVFCPSPCWYCFYHQNFPRDCEHYFLKFASNIIWQIMLPLSQASCLNPMPTLTSEQILCLGPVGKEVYGLQNIERDIKKLNCHLAGLSRQYLEMACQLSFRANTIVSGLLYKIPKIPKIKSYNLCSNQVEVPLLYWKLWVESLMGRKNQIIYVDIFILKKKDFRFLLYLTIKYDWRIQVKIIRQGFAVLANNCSGTMGHTTRAPLVGLELAANCIQSH